MAKITSATRDITFGKGLGMLRREAESPKPRPPISDDGMLPLAEIRTATSVFQPRLGDGMRGEEEAHIGDLANAIRNSKDHLLDPILVWWSGRYWRVVDGHHRLVAYQQVSNPGQKGKRHIPIERVPVTTFSGTVVEAMAQATANNSKDKLRTSKNDKLERAWKFAALGTMTIPQIAKVTAISERIVSNMRKVINEMIPPGSTEWLTAGPNPLDMTWREAKRIALGECAPDDGWVEKQAQDWARRLGKTFGRKLSDSPAIALRALEIYSENLPKQLVEHYANEAGEEDGGDD